MKLLVQVIEARNLVSLDNNNSPGSPYVKLSLGRQRVKTRAVKKNLSPCWDEEFAFRVGNLKEELAVCVVDEDRIFADDFLGHVRVPLSEVLDAENMSLGAKWYTLQAKNKKSKVKDYGTICLAISLSQTGAEESSLVTQAASDDLASNSDKSTELRKGVLTPALSAEASLYGVNEIEEPAEQDKLNAPSFFDWVYQIFAGSKVEAAAFPSTDPDDCEDPQEESLMSSDGLENTSEIASSMMSFDDMLKSYGSQHQRDDAPGTLPGGVLIDQAYAVSSGDLNSVIHSPDSGFLPRLAEMQRTTNLQVGAWRLENNGESLKRQVSYTKAPTKLVRSLKGIEQQTYLRADGEMYAVLNNVITPDAPFGSTFRVEVLFCITPGLDLPSGEKTSRLIVSWRIYFVQNTIMKGAIENGTKQGIKDNYDQYAEVLAQFVKPVDVKDMGATKEQVLSSLKAETEPNWKLAFRLLGNFTVLSSIAAFIFVVAHIAVLSLGVYPGLEFPGLDLPDSIGEVVVSVVLVLQGQRVLHMISRFMQARRQRGSDHGVKAEGQGWLLTVALLEATNLAAPSEYSDPYVIFTCSGRKKTSSVKFHTREPQWNEIFEFDATDDPPSLMEIDVYDFDGPYDEPICLGHGEVNFLKFNLSELADLWVPLQGKLAQTCQSQLHLRIFLNNSRGVDVMKEYLDKMEKEVGKKITAPSPHMNSEFQKIFSLPLEEFLINDFSCHLKRKMPTQGRLFLSPRIIGFYSNLFGHKTKFFFLWEDIEDIQLITPTLTSMGSPSLLIVLRKGRGLDAKHGARTLEDGRLKFHFQSFVSFTVAHRTIMALWKAKSLSPEQKVQLAEKESEPRSLESDGSGSFLGIEETKMSEVFSAALPFNVLVELFEGGAVERQVMEKNGHVDYSASPWESVKTDVYQRQVHYRFDNNVSQFEGEVMSTQQKSPLQDKNGWLIEEVMTLQGIPLGEYFNIHIRYQIEDAGKTQKGSNIQILLGIVWLKSIKNQKKIAKNTLSSASALLQKIFGQLEKEIASTS